MAAAPIGLSDWRGSASLEQADAILALDATAVYGEQDALSDEARCYAVLEAPIWRLKTVGHASIMPWSVEDAVSEPLAMGTVTRFGWQVKHLVLEGFC